MRDPGRGNDRRQRRQRQRSEHPVRRPQPGRAGHDRDERPRSTEQSRQPEPEARPHTRLSASRRRRSLNGRALVTYGTLSKFCGGGGEVVYHSSVSPSHGSLPARTPARLRVQRCSEEDEDRRRHHEGADRRDQVLRLPEPFEYVYMRRGIPRAPAGAAGRTSRLKPTKSSQKWHFPSPLVQHPAEHLRPPVVEPGEDAEHRAPEEHVVQVRDDEVRVLTCQSNGNAARAIPESPPIVKSAMKPRANSIGVSKMRFPRQVVASQLRIFIPVGTAITIEEIMKNPRSGVESPTVNMWWAQTSSEKKPIATSRSDRRVAEDRLAGEDGDHLGDDPHHRQDHHVHLGVAEEPEDVLEEDRVSPVAGSKKCVPACRSRRSIVRPGRESGQHDDQQRGVDLDRPHEERHAHPCHPGRAQPVDRDDEVDRTDERRDRQDVQREDQQSTPFPSVLRERRVDRPAGLRRAVRREEAQKRITSPPNRNSQYESAFSRGNATSRAPIISGTR